MPAARYTSSKYKNSVPPELHWSWLLHAWMLLSVSLHDPTFANLLISLLHHVSPSCNEIAVATNSFSKQLYPVRPEIFERDECHTQWGFWEGWKGNEWKLLDCCRVWCRGLSNPWRQVINNYNRVFFSAELTRASEIYALQVALRPLLASKRPLLRRPE